MSGSIFGGQTNNPSINVYNLKTVNSNLQNQKVLASSVRVINIIGGSVNIDSTGVQINYQLLLLNTGGKFGTTIVSDGGATQIGGSNAPQIINPGSLLFIIWNGTSWSIQPN
jgi:hypothetical protein